jgi:hypothetical protein
MTSSLVLEDGLNRHGNFYLDLLRVRVKVLPTGFCGFSAAISQREVSFVHRMCATAIPEPHTCPLVLPRFSTNQRVADRSRAGDNGIRS